MAAEHQTPRETRLATLEDSVIQSESNFADLESSEREGFHGRNLDQSRSGANRIRVQRRED